MNIKNIQDNCGFGLVDAIVSMSLLLGVITYGIYFSSLRFSTVYDSNLIRAINKEVQRDIERLKSDFWCMYFEGNKEWGDSSWECRKNQNVCDGAYCKDGGETLSRQNCANLALQITDLKGWRIDGLSDNPWIQSWTPGSKRNKVFTGQQVTITRELKVESPLERQSLDKSIASVGYRVQWGNKNIHWVSIFLGPEAHSWCDHVI